MEEILEDVVSSETDEFQYRLICLRLAHLAEDGAGRRMDLDSIMERADRYWAFIIGVDDDPEAREARRKVAEARSRLSARDAALGRW